jgi:ribosome-binding factor A
LDFERAARVNEALKEEIADILEKKLKDPRIGFVTVTGADVSPDLKHADVFVSIMGSKEEQLATFKVLHGAKGFIRSELGKRLRIKFLPELVFRIDESIEEGMRIAKLIKKIHKAEESDSR